MGSELLYFPGILVEGALLDCYLSFGFLFCFLCSFELPLWFWDFGPLGMIRMNIFVGYRVFLHYGISYEGKE